VVLRRRDGSAGGSPGGWPPPLPTGGLLLVGAVLSALPAPPGRPGGLLVGVVLLAIAGAVIDLIPVGAVVGAALAVPGAWVIAFHAGLLRPSHHQSISALWWLRPLTALVIVVAGVALAGVDRRYRGLGWAPALIAITAAGIVLTVPDTEQAFVLVGAAVALAGLGWPLHLATFGGLGALPVAGVVMWTVAYGGQGRPGSIVAGIACFGLVWAEPVGRLVVGRLVGRRVGRVLARARGRAGGVAKTLLVLGVHAALVAWAARVAGQHGTPLHALGVAAPPLALTAVGLGLLGRSTVEDSGQGASAGRQAGPPPAQPSRR